MRVLRGITLLICGFSLIGSAQQPFHVNSRLDDSTYVRSQIRDIADGDLWKALDTDQPALTRVRAAMEGHNASGSARAWAEYWTTTPRPAYVTTLEHLFLDTDLLSEVQAFRDDMDGLKDDRDTILSRAALILENTIYTWGDNVVAYGRIVDFNREIGRSGKYGFHYWYWSRPLLMAWMLTGDDRYAQKFEELFNIWYEQRNAITSSIPDLDVVYYELGLGTRNRIFIEFYLQQRGRWSLRTHERMLKTLLGAGRWLYELERWEGYRPGNWQIHGAYMLTQLALVFPEFRESRQWLDVGLQRMAEHLEQDFFTDGGHSERCPRNYTLSTYVAFRNLTYLLDRYRTRPDVAGRIRSSMGRTLEWWLTLITPNGESPAINDSHRGLFPARILTDGRILFGRNDVTGVLGSLLHDTVSGPMQYPDFTSRHLPASGFTVMRSNWTPEALYLSVNHGPSAGFHSHHDLLDIEVYAYGRPLAIDAGIGLTYDDPLYETWYRASRAHNMVVINDSNIARADQQGSDLQWGATAGLEYFAGTHRGYERFGALCRRRIAFVKPDYWFVVDDITCSRSGDTLSWYFHSPQELRPSGSGFVGTSAPGIAILPADPATVVRTGYGRAASASVLVPGRSETIPWIRFDQVGRRDSVHQYAILMSPFRSQGELRTTERLSRSHFRVVSGVTCDDIYFSDGAYTDNALQTDAQCVVIRKQDGRALEYSLVNGTYLRWQGRSVFTAPARISTTGVLLQ